jgi:hypothetical protein
VAAGCDEILDRRIGANELYTQQVVLAFVDAQDEYFQGLRDGRKVHVYAQHLFSSPGKQDGFTGRPRRGSSRARSGRSSRRPALAATIRVRMPNHSLITAITSMS